MKAIRAILFALNVVLALGLIASTLAGSVAPSTSIWPSLMAFAYPVLALANALMLVVWLLLRRWGTALLPAAAIAARWGMVGLFFQPHISPSMQPRPEEEACVRLMTYNVHQFKGAGAEPTPSDSNAQAFLALVRQHAPDVLCLQEYAAAKGMSVTDSLELMGYNHYFGAHTAASGSLYGTVVFSRLPITYVKRIDAEKVLVEVLAAQHMRICCIHLDSYRFSDADREEIERMRHGEVKPTARQTLGKVRKTILSHEHEWQQLLLPVVSECTMPLVVAGDFNDIPSSYIYHQLASHLTDAYAGHGAGYGITYNGGWPRYRIDWVMHNQGLSTLRYKRLRTAVSDHYPVVVDLSFNN